MGTNSFVNLPTIGVGYAATVRATTATELSTFVTLGPLTEGGYANGQEAFVESTGLAYVLRASVGTADGINIIATLDDLTRQWVIFSYGETTAAQWTIGLTRVYAIDGLNGNNANKGYADPASSSAADYATACQAAGAVALKTVAGLADIFPRLGNDRNVEIVIANGGVNTIATYASALTIALAGTIGYAAFVIRGTGTNTTAGCVAFDGSANDSVYLGGMTGTGLNVPGYTPTGVPTTTTVQCTLFGGGAPAFAAEPAIPCGLRVRFDNSPGTTVQVALRNICRTISKIAGSDTLTWSSALPAIPTATDTFYIEQAGVSIPGLVCTTNFIGANINATAAFAGLAFTSSVSVANGQWITAFCQFSQLTEQNNQSFVAFTGYTHPVLGFKTVGSCRDSGTFSSTRSNPNLNAVTIVSSSNFSSPFNGTTIAGGTTFGNGVTFVDPKIGLTFPAIGSSGAIVGVGPRVLAGSLIINGGGTIRIDQVDSSNSASAGIYIGGNGVGESLTVDFGSVNVNNAITGTGNVITGMYTAFAKKVTFILNTGHLPTITGPNDLYLSNNIQTTWATVANSGLGFNDNGGNQYLLVGSSLGGAQAASTGKLKFSGTLLGGGASVFTYLTDDGEIVPGANNTTLISYPMDGFYVTRLMVKPRVNTMTHDCTATVYSNGVATAVTVTIPAGTTAVVSWTGTGNIAFPFGGLLDLRLDNASADVGHSLIVSAILASA